MRGAQSARAPFVAATIHIDGEKKKNNQDMVFDLDDIDINVAKVNGIQFQKAQEEFCKRDFATRADGMLNVVQMSLTNTSSAQVG